MKKSTAVMVPKMSDVNRVVVAEQKDAERSLKLVQDTEISTQAEYSNSVSIIAEVKDRVEEVEERRDGLTGPLKSVIEDIEKLFSPVLESLKGCEKELKEQVAGYNNRCVLQRSDLLSKVENETNESAREELIVAADHFIVEKVKGCSLRDKWGGEITDAEAIVKWAIKNKQLELLKPDEKALKALTKLKTGSVNVPGWKPEHSTTVAITKDKVDR